MGVGASKAKVHHAESRAEEEMARAQRAEADTRKAREEAANALAIARRELQAEAEETRREAAAAAETTRKAAEGEAERMKEEAAAAAEASRKAAEEEAERIKQEAAAAAEASRKAAEEEAARVKQEAAAAAEASRKAGNEVKEAGVAAPAAQSEDPSLRVEFNKFADAKDDKGEPCMSRAGLEGALAALNLTQKADDLKTRFDMNRDGLIDFAEFQLIKNSDPELEMLLRSFGLEAILAALLPKGTKDDPLSGFFGMTDAAVDAIVSAFQPLVATCLKGNIQRGKDAKKAMEKLTSAAGAKFDNPLKGGDIDFYYKGVTAIVGEHNHTACLIPINNIYRSWARAKAQLSNKRLSLSMEGKKLERWKAIIGFPVSSPSALL
jgi:chemotaxis protein histidine kinase CheA